MQHHQSHELIEQSSVGPQKMKTQILLYNIFYVCTKFLGFTMYSSVYRPMLDEHFYKQMCYDLHTM